MRKSGFSRCRPWFASPAADRVRGIVGIIEQYESGLDIDC